MRRLLFASTALVALTFAPSQAVADPVSTAIITALGGSAALGTVGVALVKIGVGAAFSYVARAISGQKQKPAQSGIKTQSRTQGESTPQSFILGRYATKGNLVAPYYSHKGEGHSTPNSVLNQIVDFGDVPITGLSRVFLNGEVVTFDGAGGAGQRQSVTTGDYDGALHMRWYDGTQTAADPYLIEHYSSDPDRPWTADMVGRGVPHAILELFYNSDGLWQSGQDFLFEGDGAALLDPRTATAAFTQNPMVMASNLLRGITLPDGATFGGGFDADDLPSDVWHAAMDKADSEGFIAGYEIKVGTPDVGGETPAQALEELLKACSAEIADVGGTVYTRVGGPDLPVAFITDDDILRSRPQDLDPFPGLNDSYNGVHATYPDPDSAWETRDAPPRYDAAAEAEDGRRLIASLDLPAVPNGDQVQRLMAAWLKDARRMRRHQITLPPEGILYRPLQTIAWTSARNGYDAKLFEISDMAIDPMTLATTLSLREVDPADYDWDGSDLLPTEAPSAHNPPPVVQSLPGFGVAAVSLKDASGIDRRPAIQCVWTGGQNDIASITLHARVKATGAALPSKSVTDILGGVDYLTEGILPGVTYEVQATYRVNGRPTVPTGWITVIADDVRLGRNDLADAIRTKLDNALTEINSATQFAQDIRPVEVVDTLPTTGNTAGRMVFLTTDNKLYRYDGTSWTAAVPAVDVTGQLTSAQIASLASTKISGQLTDAQIQAVAAAKLTGSITSTQITDGSISTPKLAAGAVSAAKIAAGAVTTEKLTVGGGKNLLHNTEFWGALSGWAMITNGAAGAATNLAIRSPADTWAGRTYPTIRMFQDTGDTVGYSDLRNISIYSDAGATDPGVPVASGSYYEFSVNLSLHRCDGQLRIQWFDDAGATISYSGPVSAPNGSSSSTNPDAWPRYAVRGQAPANAAKAAIHLRKFGTLTGNTNSYLFAHKPQLAETVANATEMVPYGPGGVSKIDGGQILTNSVTTRLLAAGAVTADTIASNAITTAKLAAGAVTANTIASNAITSDKITANAITTGKIAAGAVKADQIDAGAVTADKAAFTDLASLNLTVGSADIVNGAIGNAKIGNAAVDTLQIAGNAATIPAYASAANQTKSTPGEATLVSVSLTRRGYATALAMTCQLDGPYDPSLNTSTYLIFRLYRDATAIGAFHMQASRGRASAAFNTVDTNTGTGATTYHLKAEIMNHVDETAYFFAPFISAHQFQR